ncbi:MAG: DinB family protein [Ardenticatenaceae bacterium]|nr:DinB family protein [Ardenticatenaceae bacterium]
MKTTVRILEHILDPLSDAQWRTWHDGEDGWTILEVVCHLRDFEEIFLGRAQKMIQENHPDLGRYDHEAMAIDRKYNEQSIPEAWEDLVSRRERFVAFFEGLSENQWAATGDHPERESFSMLDALMQVGLHDTNHIEQITRIIKDGKVETRE